MYSRGPQVTEVTRREWLWEWGKWKEERKRGYVAVAALECLPSVLFPVYGNREVEGMMRLVKKSRLACMGLGLMMLTALGARAAGATNDELSAADRAAIKTTIEAYRAAWLASDSKGVLKTFTEDAVLMPAHGGQAVVGIQQIENYWFTPGGPPTRVTALNITFDQISGNGDLAFARGLGSGYPAC